MWVKVLHGIVLNLAMAGGLVVLKYMPIPYTVFMASNISRSCDLGIECRIKIYRYTNIGTVTRCLHITA